MESRDSNAQLIKLTPSSTLIFPVERGTQPKTILRVANRTQNKILFKVKTTQPSWYYVRPNQQILSADQVEEVSILMVETECNRYLDQLGQNSEEKLDKHRFLVQSKIISEEDYNRIIALPASQRSDEYSKLWDGPTIDKKSVKLKVEFNVLTTTSTVNTVTAKDSSRTVSATDNVEPSLRNRLSSSNNSSSSGAGRSNSGTIGEDGSSNGSNNSISNSGSASSNGSPEVIFSELQGLRKKYDAVVEYTVHLTAERDAIVSQLETTQRELTKEKAKKRTSNNATTAADTTSSAITSSSSTSNGGGQRVVEKGFSLFVVIFAALICLLIGKFFI